MVELGWNRGAQKGGRKDAQTRVSRCFKTAPQGDRGEETRAVQSSGGAQLAGEAGMRAGRPLTDVESPGRPVCPLQGGR